MNSMPRRSFLLLSVFVAVCGLIALTLVVSAQEKANRGRKYRAPAPTARIEVTVLRDGNGKPVENAAVIFHPMEGEKDKGNMELKTNEDGKTIIDVLPIGATVRMQIVMRGFQTYGDDYKIDKANMAIEIRLKRPGEQYSIYEKHDDSLIGGQTTAQPKDAAPTPATDKDKPVTQPGSQTSPPQHN